jgi:RNA polymerase sigma-70 factor (ECF subfamily)
MQAQALAAVADPSGSDDPVVRARSGDPAAFDELYRKHVGRVYGLCLRMTADPARAEDGTQEAFIRAWQKLGTLRPGGDFGAWVRRVAVNAVLGEGRSIGRRLRFESSLREPMLPDRTAATPGVALDLERAMTRLPPGAREVFVLHDVEGYRHEEIGEMLGVAAGTSKSQLHRARKLLREALR